MFDLIIRNGTVVDGSGLPRFRGDVGVTGRRIAAVARWPQTICAGGAATEHPRVIDAGGRTVAPGFFDIHSHADRGIVAHPEAENCLSQGITSVIGGNCGGSAAPLNDVTAERLVAAGLRAGHKADPSDVSWRSMGEFLGTVEATGTAINLGTLVGQGTVRDLVMGPDARRPSSEEIGQMQKHVETGPTGGGAGGCTHLS